MDSKVKHILISRTDSIGDVILTLPVCVALKNQYPDLKITFLASGYTLPVVRICTAIDHVLDFTELTKLPLEQQIDGLKSLDFDMAVHVFPRKELARLFKKAKIPLRVGTSHRLYHTWTCNIRPSFTRKNSDLHEAQLNFKLFEDYFNLDVPTLEELSTILHSCFVVQFKDSVLKRFTQKRAIILHPKSQGSAREWPIEKYVELAKYLSSKDFSVLFTGTEKEGTLFKNDVPWDENIIDTSGKLTLDELIRLIEESAGIVACSTGPLHISGALNKPTVGIYSPRKPIHPGRWGALGINTQLITTSDLCHCSSVDTCTCVAEVSLEQVIDAFADLQIT